MAPVGNPSTTEENTPPPSSRAFKSSSGIDGPSFRKRILLKLLRHRMVYLNL